MSFGSDGLAVGTLYKISQAVIETENLNDLCRSIHEALNEVLPASDFYIALYDPASETISFPYYIDQYDAPPAPQKVGRGLTEYVLRTETPLLAPQERFQELVQCGEVEVSGTPSIDWLGVPLRVSTRLIGVMAMQSYSEAVRFGQDELNMLAFVSSQIGLALERRRTVEEMRQRLNELTVLHAVSSAGVEVGTEGALIEFVTQLIGRTLYVDNFGVLLLDDETGELYPHASYHGMEHLFSRARIPAGKGITGAVARTGRSMNIPDVDREPLYLKGVGHTCSELCVPLWVGGRVIGVLNAESPQRNAFSDADERLVETVAGLMATGLEKLRLLQESRRQAQRLSALRTIDLSINTNNELPITLHVLLDQTVSQLGVDAAAIYLFNTYHQMLEFAAGKGFRATPYQRGQIRLGQGVAGRVALERTPIYVPSFLAVPDLIDPSLQLAGEDFKAYFGVPVVAKGWVKGVLEVFHRQPLRPEPEWLEFLNTLAGQAAIAIDNANLIDALQRSNNDLSVAYEATLEGWSRALELRDYETEGHTLRVTDLTLRLARVMGMGDADLVHIRRGALLHDIGKLGIPDNILRKPGPLTQEEWATMMQHPTYAFKMIYPIPYLRPALDIPYRHHEKWDGSGYPAGLRGEQIPLAARLFAVVDVWDALTSDRPYRKAWSWKETREYICSQVGQHFDPRVVEAFLTLI